MNSFVLALRQVKYENTVFWRNPVAAFFTFVFPLMFLVIFNLIFGNRELPGAGGTISTSTFYVPAIVGLSVIGACYTNVAMGVSFSRDEGVLKRVRGTPLPAWSLLCGKVLHSVLVALLLVAIVTLAGVLFYDVDPPTNTMPSLSCDPHCWVSRLLHPWPGRHLGNTQFRRGAGHRPSLHPAAALYIRRVYTLA